MDILSKDSKYKILKKISEGAFGTIYDVVEILTGREYALKQIQMTKDKQSLVPREVKILSKLSHPNIVKLIEVEEKQWRVNLVFEKCEHDLLQLIQSSQYPINKNLAAHIFKQILQGVQYLHSVNILHRDLKPANILITSTYQVKICDFGSAVQTNEKQVKGEFDLEGFTKWYKAPEMLFGDRRYDQKVDMWSLGCVFAELLTGLPLFTASNEIQQIVRISSLLGSPDVDNWPSIAQLPDYGKILFNKKDPCDFKEYFGTLGKDEINVLKKMLNYEKRYSAEEILKEQYFSKVNSGQEFTINWREKEKSDDGYFNYKKLIPKESKA